MPRIFKDLQFNLLQRDPARESGEFRIRSGAPEPSGSRARKEAVRRRADSRLGILMALFALSVSFWVADGKDALLIRLGYQSVAPLPDPPASLRLDDQARYWTYALYDFNALKRRYQVSGYFAIDAALARNRLDALLPHVSIEAIGEISAYATIAYHAMPRSRLRP